MKFVVTGLLAGALLLGAQPLLLAQTPSSSTTERPRGTDNPRANPRTDSDGPRSTGTQTTASPATSTPSGTQPGYGDGDDDTTTQNRQGGRSTTQNRGTDPNTRRPPSTTGEPQANRSPYDLTPDSPNDRVPSTTKGSTEADATRTAPPGSVMKNPARAVPGANPNPDR